MFRVTASGLNLRNGPGTQYPVLRVLTRHTALIPLVECMADWLQVETFTGQSGWVARSHVTHDLAPWMQVARGELGVAETPGPRHTNRILEYHATTTLRATSDEIAWCSSFVNWVFVQAGILGTSSAAARSWLDWGCEINAPREGCVAVLSRGLNPASGHVGFYVGSDGGRVRLLGGNQGNAVSIASFPASRVLGYRLPIAA